MPKLRLGTRLASMNFYFLPRSDKSDVELVSLIVLCRYGETRRESAHVSWAMAASHCPGSIDPFTGEFPIFNAALQVPRDRGGIAKHNDKYCGLRPFHSLFSIILPPRLVFNSVSSGGAFFLSQSLFQFILLVKRDHVDRASIYTSTVYTPFTLTCV